MAAKEKHYVRFYSPGTLFSEETVKEIPSWDTKLAAQMAKDVVERYNARPFGFRFETRLDFLPVIIDGVTYEAESRTTAKSGMHFLGGTIQTREEVLAGNDPQEAILRTNVECNGWPAIVTNCNSFKSTQSFEKDSVLLDQEGNVVRTGKDLQQGVTNG